MKVKLSPVYLDNAATTPMDPAVIEAISEVMRTTYGNPSATHAIGRKARGVVETCRKNIANLLGAESSEIVFTSGGTEADNMAIRCAVKDLNVTTIITCKTEHKAVLETVESVALADQIKVAFVHQEECGSVDMEHLNHLAQENPGALISLMHANNEIGTLLDYHTVSRIAKENDCYFHSDTVQTMGHYPINVKEFKADFLACSAHKLHGPKGVGFLYIRKGLKIAPIITGGGQERSLRPGTENINGIVGLDKALSLALENVEEDIVEIQGLKSYMLNELKALSPDIVVNGQEDPQKSLYTVLNVMLPKSADQSLALLQLDLEGICCSGGSACNSGAQAGSHVLSALQRPVDQQAVRFSFSRFTTKEDIDRAVKAVASISLIADHSSAIN